MKMLARVLPLIVLLSTTTCRVADAKELHIHMLSGSGEYKSAQSLPKWAALLEKEGHLCTIGSGVQEEEDIANLKKCDLLVVFCKRWKLDETALGHVKAAATTKPIIGIRTASHAFQTWLAFENEVMGGTYSGHGATGEVTVILQE